MNMQTIRTYSKEIGEGKIRMMRIRPRDDEMHQHVFFELVYIVSGTAIHHLGEESAQIRAGDYFIIDTGSFHCYRQTQDFEIVNCLFLPEYIDRALADCPSLSSLLSNQILRFGVPVNARTADRIFHDDDGTVKRLIRIMEQEYTAGETGYMELLRCYLTQVMVHAVRASEKVERTRTPHAATTAIVEYLRQHYAKPLALNELSRKLGYTPQYLSGLFHKDTGMSLQVFLQRLRVEEACRLIGEGEKRIAVIAQKVGYNDAKYFSGVFRRHKGMSLQEFRGMVV